MTNRLNFYVTQCDIIVNTIFYRFLIVLYAKKPIFSQSNVKLINLIHKKTSNHGLKTEFYIQITQSLIDQEVSSRYRGSITNAR